MLDIFNKEIALGDRVKYFGAVNSKVYPEDGLVKQYKDGKFLFKPDNARKAKWLSSKSVLIRLDPKAE